MLNWILVIALITLLIYDLTRKPKSGFLPDYEIEKREMITPYNPKQLQPASYDLKLEKAEHSVIMPGESMLGVTEEVVTVPDDLVGLVFGKSSIGREFLNIHYAGFIDPGFSGQIVLEFTNNSEKPIEFDRYETIAQIAFVQLSDVPDQLYNGHYQNQRGIKKSWIQEENES